MKKMLLISFFGLLTHVVMGQTYYSKKATQEGYYCALQVLNDSAVNFIYERDSNGIYADYQGSLSQLHDSVYKVSAKMYIGQFYMKSFHKDTLYIQLDSIIALQLDKISVVYADGKFRQDFQGYDRNGHPLRLLKMPINKDLFNEKKGKDYVTIQINRKNFLSDDFLSFRIPYGSAASFTKGAALDFEVVIKHNRLYTVGMPPNQTGHFKLELK